MKKILVIQGGGRAKGNTAQLVNSFVAGAEESGHSVEAISLLKNEVKGCLGCNACRYGKPCIQKDAFNDLVVIFEYSYDMFQFFPCFFSAHKFFLSVFRQFWLWDTGI